MLWRQELFIQLTEKWLSAAKAYCFAHPLETIEISYYLMHYQKLKTRADKRFGRLYGYVEDDQLVGLILFNNKGVMYISNQSAAIYEKVDFLKAIHREKPTLIKGSYQQVDKVFYFLQRALKSFDFTTSVMMIYQMDHMGKQITDNPNIVNASSLDWRLQSQFMFEVEQNFRHQPMIINQLRNKLSLADGFDFYNFYTVEGRIVAQLIGEISTWAYGVLGGLYTTPKVRGKGYARQMMQHGIERYLNMRRQPLLYVAKDNDAALRLYEQLGFKVIADTMEMTIAL